VLVYLVLRYTTGMTLLKIELTKLTETFVQHAVFSFLKL